MRWNLAACFTLAALCSTMHDALRADTIVVTNERSGSVVTIDSSTDTVRASAPIATRIRGVVLEPTGDRALIAVSHFRDRPAREPDGVMAIDLRTLRVVRRYGAGTDPEGIALTPDGREFVVSNEDAGTASIVDVGNGRPLATLVTGTEPEGVAVSPDGKWIYVTAETSSTVTAIDAKKRAVVGNIFVSARPRGVLFSPDSRRAWVTSEIGGSIDLIDVPTQKVLTKLRLAKNDHPVGLVLRGDLLYVATGRGNSVAIIDTRNDRLRLLREIPVGSRPWWLAFTKDGRKLYVANGLSNDISVIDVASSRVTRNVKVPADGPWGVAVRHDQ